MTINEQYFVPVSKDITHLLEGAENSEIEAEDFFIDSSLGVTAEGKKLCVDVVEGDRNNFVPSDYYATPCPIVSHGMAEIIKSIVPTGFDLYPCEISNGKKIWDGFYALHVWSELSVLDLAKSEHVGGGDSILLLESLSFDENKTKRYPEDKLKLFCLGESWKLIFGYELFSEFEKMNLKGVQFIPVGEWHIGSMFE